MNKPRLLPRLASLLIALIAVASLALPALAQVGSGLGSSQAPASAAQPAVLAQSSLPTAVPAAPPAATGASAGFTPFWVEAFQQTNFWSDSTASAQPLAPVAVDSPLQVLQPQNGSRLYVSDPLTGTTAWVDATSVGPIDTPTADQLAALANPPSATAFQPYWVMTDKPTTLWSAADSTATSLAAVPQWRYYEVVQPQQGNRDYAQDPRTLAYGWLDANSIGPVGAPPLDYFGSPPPDDQTLNLPARIIGTTDLYEQPEKANYFSLNSMVTNDPITVIGSVNMSDGTWEHLDNGDYVPSDKVRLPDPPQQTFTGRWIDASLTEPVIVTAYQGTTPVYAALAVKGTTAFQTPVGTFHILRRVADETMNSETLSPPIPRDGPGGYYLQHVLDTQYFTNDGSSIHYNYWYANWGYAGSHGCLGMNLTDATFFWNFADIGTVVNVHE